jgi:hypothetical protein
MQPDLLTLIFKLLPAILALMIPIAAIVGGIIVKLRRLQTTHETIRRLGELGQPIPHELLAIRDPYSRWSPKHQLHVGAVNVGVGLGLMIMFYAIKPGGWMWAIGCVPLFVGIAMLIVWRMELHVTES